MEIDDVTLEEGATLVREARSVVEAYLRMLKKVDVNIPKRLHKKLGVFVTIEKYPSHELRGCIGFPKPIFDLRKGLVEASISAASRDPRFIPMNVEELKNVTFEVSILTPPEKIKYKSLNELRNSITIGVHGLIAKKNGYEGLLLPQVPVEYKWNVDEFLSHTCSKAGLPSSSWRSGDVVFYSFSGVVFTETEPKGEVIRKNLAVNRD